METLLEQKNEGDAPFAPLNRGRKNAASSKRRPRAPTATFMWGVGQLSFNLQANIDLGAKPGRFAVFGIERGCLACRISDDAVDGMINIPITGAKRIVAFPGSRVNESLSYHIRLNRLLPFIKHVRCGASRSTYDVSIKGDRCVFDNLKIEKGSG